MGVGTLRFYPQFYLHIKCYSCRWPSQLPCALCHGCAGGDQPALLPRLLPLHRWLVTQLRAEVKSSWQFTVREEQGQQGWGFLHLGCAFRSKFCTLVWQTPGPEHHFPAQPGMCLGLSHVEGLSPLLSCQLSPGWPLCPPGRGGIIVHQLPQAWLRWTEGSNQLIAEVWGSSQSSPALLVVLRAAAAWNHWEHWLLPGTGGVFSSINPLLINDWLQSRTAPSLEDLQNLHHH